MQRMKLPNASDGLSALVENLGQQLPLLDAKRAGAELYGAPRLSPYELLKPNENALSRVVGDLFDPRGTHGQGSLFLNALLGELGLPRVGVRDTVRVRREVLTEERRRIDIVIETPAVLLGIENKPWAGQQRNQLSDYYRELRNRAGGRRFVLVFLSGQEEESAQGDVVRMPYQSVDDGPSLYGLLSSVVGAVRAVRVRAHVEDFMRYIGVQFGEGQVIEEGDEPYVQAVQAEFDGGPVKRKAIATVLLSQSKLHARILDEIGAFLLREVRGKVNEDFVPEGATRHPDVWKSNTRSGVLPGRPGQKIVRSGLNRNLATSTR